MNETDRKAAQWHVEHRAKKDLRSYRFFIFFLSVVLLAATSILFWYILK